MSFIYQLSIFIYSQLLKLVALWHPKAKSMVEGRKKALGILKQVPKSTNKRFWFHCASLGEYDMALPLIEACKATNPKLEIFVSFYSPSGMQHYHKRGFVPTAVFYLPADTMGQMKALVEAIEADRLYLLKYEFWPSLMAVAKKAKLEVLAVSTILRPSQVYFKWYGGIFRKALRNVSHFSVQNKATQELLLALGVAAPQIEILGDLRWNRVFAAKEKALANPLIESFKAEQPLFILGSSWPEEENILAAYLRTIENQHPTSLHKILIAPHDLSKGHLEDLKSKFTGAVFYSEFLKNQEKEHEKVENEFKNFQIERSFSSSNHTILSEAKIFILDTIGQLSAAYQYGDFAFVGGGFSGSLHNILEPAAYGLPILFGPKHGKFPEAQQLIDLGFALEVQDEHELENGLKHFALWDAQHKNQMMSQVQDLKAHISERLLS
jgi:3-deoxy-D-manno-octulosonic-acid transferase